MKRAVLLFALVALACTDPSPSGPIRLTPDQTHFGLPPGGIVEIGFTVRNDADLAVTWLTCPASAWLERREGRRWISLRRIALLCVVNPPTYQIDPGGSRHDLLGVDDGDGPGLYRIRATVGGPATAQPLEGISAPFTVDRFLTTVR